jgi:hypothetical protein
MMACEEAWLLGQYIRSIDPKALLVLGPVPRADSDEVFKNPATGKVTFTNPSRESSEPKGYRARHPDARWRNDLPRRV